MGIGDLARKVRQHDDEVLQLYGLVQQVDTKVDDLAEQMAARFDAVDNRFTAQDNRSEAVDERFDAVDRRFDAVDERFDAMEEFVESRLGGLDGKLDELLRRLGGTAA